MTKVEIGQILDMLEIVETKSRPQKVKKDYYSENIDTIELPPIESLDPLTKKLVRLGLVDLKDALEFQEEQKRQERERPTIYTVFDYFDRIAELERIKGIIEKTIREKKDARMVRIPFFAFRQVRPDITWRDLDRIAKEISEEQRDLRVTFEDGYLNVVIA